MSSFLTISPLSKSWSTRVRSSPPLSARPKASETETETIEFAWRYRKWNSSSKSYAKSLERYFLPTFFWIWQAQTLSPPEDTESPLTRFIKSPWFEELKGTLL